MFGRSSSSWSPRVAVIGSGFGGLTSGYLLRKQGFTNFTIYERAADIGGTWYHNDYPGAEVDIPSHLYSFPFKTNLWTRTHAQQPELKRYIDDMADEFGLREHLALNCGVAEAVWDDARQRYDLTLSDGTRSWANVIICATGLFNQPKIPDWPGLEDFSRPAFHTTEWDHDLDLSGKTVAVVGTGSTSTQIVATIAPLVKKLYVYQREPGWVLPKGDHDFTEDELAKFGSERKWRYRVTRLQQFYQMQKFMFAGRAHKNDSKTKQLMEDAARAHIEAEFGDHPALREAVTPTYPLGGKRPVLNGQFYPALKRDNVELVPHAVTSVTETEVVSADGIKREVDVLVMATGFQAANFISTMRLVGRTGRTIQEVWGGEPRAFVGVQTREFPNFYMLYGPNTNGGEIFLNFKTQAGVAVKNLRSMVRNNLGSFEVKQRWEDGYNRWLDKKLTNSVWTSASNYYKSPKGRVVTQMPFDAVTYTIVARLIRRPAQETKRRVVVADEAPGPTAVPAAVPSTSDAKTNSKAGTR